MCFKALLAQHNEGTSGANYVSQAKKHRELLAQVKAELNLPKSLRRYAKIEFADEP